MIHPPYQLSICGKHELDKFAGRQVTHLLSIEDPGTHKETPGWFRGPHVQLQFNDVETRGHAVAIQGTMPSRTHVMEILKMGASCLEAATSGSVHLLVHCYAGVSRSTAASFALVSQAVGVHRANAALGYVVNIRPIASPNRELVRIADELLMANGRLVVALKAFRA